MKKFIKLLKEKRWRWTAGGVACLVVAAMIFALSADFGVRAESITLGNNVSVEFEKDGSAYLIQTAEQLIKLGNATEGTSGKTFKLANDLEVNISAPATGNFEGTFDGGGHVIEISSLNITENMSNNVSQGALFGKIAANASISNVIVDIQGNNAKYERSSDNEVKEKLGNPEYGTPDGNVILNSNVFVNGVQHAEDAGKIAALPESVDSDGGKYRIQKINTPGTQTTTYSVEAGKDYFGLICGENAGTIEKVYLTGKDVSIVRNGRKADLYSTQTGSKTDTYYYKEEKIDVLGVEEKKELSLTTNVTEDSEPENPPKEGGNDSGAAPSVTAEEIQSKNPVTFGNGLEATLNVTPGTATVGDTLTYTLILKNTLEKPAEGGLILSNDIVVTADSLSGWTLSDTQDGSSVTKNVKIAAGTKKTFTKTVTAQNAGEQTEKVSLSAQLSNSTYQYSLDETKTVSGQFTLDNSEPTTKEELDIGNVLYAGGIVGKNEGTIKEVKQAVNLTGTEITDKFAIGGIAGEAVNGLSDIYMLGKVNSESKYVGSGSAQPSNSALSAPDTKPNSGNWSSYVKYDTAGKKNETYDLDWLIKSETDTDKFTYTFQQDEKKISVERLNPVRTADLTYSVVYNARKSLDDTSEDTLYQSGSIELGDSAFYKVLNSYATDGYYHYYSAVDNVEAAVRKFPYDITETVNPYEIAIGEDGKTKISLERSKNPLDDRLRITLNNYLSGTVYYNKNENSVPNNGANTNTDHVDVDSYDVYLPYTRPDASSDAPSDVSYKVVPVVEGRIYPALNTGTVTASVEPLPKPTVTVYNYYGSNGEKNEYASISANGSYEAGSEILIAPTDDSGENYSFRYMFSKTAPVLMEESSEWSGQRYVGDDNAEFINDFNNTTSGAKEYEGSAVIPTEYVNGGDVYLYVETSKQKYDSEIYYYGPFTVSAKHELTSKGPTQGSNVVITGDHVEISGNPSGTSIQYFISKVPMVNYANVSSWKTYSDGIPMNQSLGGYIYARIDYGNSNEQKYSEVFGFPYTFGGICPDATISPNTGVGTGNQDTDEASATTISSSTSITLSSRVENTNPYIFYLISDKFEEIKVQRAQSVPNDLKKEENKAKDGGYVYGDSKYYEIGNRWYLANSKSVQKYSAPFQLMNETKEEQLQYISTIAIADGYENSQILNYVYFVKPAEQVATPEAAYETRYLPGGENLAANSVPVGTKLTFYSLTPEATLYYAVGSNKEEPATEMKDGVIVEGNYGSNFVVRVCAKKNGMLDSEAITFIYKISDQEKVAAPTATPGTEVDLPTVVIPGNKILLSTATNDASIFYTIDGSSPVVQVKADGTGYESGSAETYEYIPEDGITMPVTGTGAFTITAVAVKTGMAQSEEVHFVYHFPDAVLKPYATLDSGKVALNAQVALKNLTEDAVIYYTIAYGTDVPADPTFTSSVFDEEHPFIITQKTTIRAMAAKDGVQSEIVEFVFEPMEQLAAPTASIASGSVVVRGSVLDLKAAEGATIYYTMDGSDPADSTNTAVMAGNSLILNGEAGGQITIKAFAKASDKSQSKVVTFTYQFSQNAGGVTASIENGTEVSNGTKVNLMSDVTDGEIYYTTDGSSPVKDGHKGTTVEINGEPGSTFTIKAVVIVNNEPGVISTFIYRIKEKPVEPTASPAGGTLTVATRVTLSSSGEKIYYTTDGTTPTKSSSLYTEPILINRSTVLMAIAESDNGEMSDVVTFTYTAAEKAASVTSSVEDGKNIESGEIIRLSTNTSGAKIYYSTDGTEPTVNNLDTMLLYDENGIQVNRSVTIHAVAYRDDLRLSEVKTWSYIVDTIPAVEKKRAEAERLAEEGLKDTDFSELSRKTDSEEEKNWRTVREKQYNTAISYSENALPAIVKLETEKADDNPYTVKKAKGIFGDDTTVLESYKVKVKSKGTGIQPSEEVELMFKIPKGYEDAVLTVAAVDRDHNLTTMETIREAEVLHIRTEKLGNYVIIGPEREADSAKTFPYLLILEITAGAVLLTGVGYYIFEKIKKKAKKSRKKR